MKRIMPAIAHGAISWIQRVGVILLVTVTLSGCVQYDVGVNFNSQTHGEIVQRIQLSERLTSFSSTTVKEWLDSIDRRARDLEGRTKRTSSQGLMVTIPFNNGAELERKFNRFFNPVEQNTAKELSEEMERDLPQLSSNLDIRQNNFILVLRNRLALDLDLRSLGFTSNEGDVLVSPSSLLELDFRLNTPWGARSIAQGENALMPEPNRDSTQLLWQLQPGQINHIEAVFWLPSPVGIGAVLIILFVTGGFYLKYRLLPALGIGRRSQQPQPSGSEV
jgi:hypothetical protein